MLKNYYGCDHITLEETDRLEVEITTKAGERQATCTLRDKDGNREVVIDFSKQTKVVAFLEDSNLRKEQLKKELINFPISEVEKIEA